MKLAFRVNLDLTSQSDGDFEAERADTATITQEGVDSDQYIKLGIKCSGVELLETIDIAT